MGRTSVVRRLPLETQAVVERCIRAHSYGSLDVIVDELTGLGVKLSRSSLHRHAKALRDKDGLCALPEEGTIVTIVERGTGEVRVVKTSASGAAVSELLERIRSPASIS